MKKTLNWAKPKRSQTESDKKRMDKLAKIAIHGKEEARLNVRMSIELYNRFAEKCFKNRTTKSRQVVAMILNYLKE